MDELLCPRCRGNPKYYDKVKRNIIEKNRLIRRVDIVRYRCMSCGHVFRDLPDYILPYKQYHADIINGVVEGLITCETKGFEDYPCEQTMARWRTQSEHLLL